ncbi:hypothetical protein [Legionella santicrucis]|nr:hypothetical protein [Legionella santicrucis]
MGWARFRLDVDLAAIEVIDKVRTEDLAWSRENLAAPSILEVPLHIGTQ